MAPIIVPASQRHLEELGEHPKGSGRAFAALHEGRVLGVAGYYGLRDQLVLYSKVLPELRAWRKTIVRGARMALGAALRLRAPIVAVADPEIPGSARLLEGLGFEQIEGALYCRPSWPSQR